MRISDWSSDVCSSDLLGKLGVEPQQRRLRRLVGAMEVAGPAERAADVAQTLALRLQAAAVGATHRLDARNQPRRLLLQAIEAHAAIIGQALLGRVEHL